jgi:hypothetical protein
MTTQYSIHMDNSKETFINFRHFNRDPTIRPFAVFEISNDNNIYTLYMNEGEPYQNFLTRLAEAVQKEIETFGGKDQDILNGESA